MLIITHTHRRRHYTTDGIALAPEDAAGGFRVAQFGPLFSLSTRVNELLLRVAL